MNRNLILFAPVIAAFALSSCGGGSGSDSVSQPNTVPSQAQVIPAGTQPLVTSTVLRSFSVEGTAPVPSGVLVPLNPAENNGEFVVSWDAASTNSIYHGRLYFSIDDQLSNEDSQFLGINCGPAFSTLSGCDAEGEFTCQITNDNMIGCDKSVRQRNISFFLDQIPKNAHLILEVCDASLTDCVTDVVGVQVQ